MDVFKRRYHILRILCRRRHETIQNLAFELAVSDRTMRRDIELLSQVEPIYTQQGRYSGGVYVTDNFNMERMFFKTSELEMLHKILSSIQTQSICQLSEKEIKMFEELIEEFTKKTKNSEVKIL